MFTKNASRTITGVRIRFPTPLKRFGRRSLTVNVHKQDPTKSLPALATVTNVLPRLDALLPGSLSTPLEDSVQQRVVVNLPDLFSSSVGILQDAPVNPYYEQVRKESETWLAEAASLDQEFKAAVSRKNMSFWYACQIADAPSAGLRTMCDWGNWFVPMDDLFDDGFITSVAEAEAMVKSLLAITNTNSISSENSLDKHPLVQAHDELWLRIKAVCPEGILRRYRHAMERYGEGVIQQVHNEHGAGAGARWQAHIGVEEMLDNRRLCIGVEPIYAFVEAGLGLRIPDDVFEHWTIKELERVIIDVVIISNDIVSYRKEEAERNPHNLVAAYRRSGLGPQEAFDTVGAMLNDLYKRWHIALAAVPSWGEAVDRDVSRYIDGVKGTAVGHNNWCFKVDRYFGKSSESVKATMKTDVLADAY